VCKIASCIPTVKQQGLRDRIRYSSADRKDNRMQTEERPRHSTKQQYYTEQKQLKKCELILKTAQNSKNKYKPNPNFCFIKRTFPLTHIQGAYIYIYICVCVCVCVCVCWGGGL
jgi:hypothetical protein